MNDERKPGISRRKVLQRGALAVGAVSIGVTGFSGTVLAHGCPRTPGFWANHNWCEVVANPDNGNTVGDSLPGISCANGDATGTYELAGTGVSKTMSGWQEFLTSPPKGDKSLIMAKHLLATELNFHRRSGDDGDCVDEEIDLSEFGLGETTIRDVKRDAADWLRASSFGSPMPFTKQKSWTVTVDGTDVDGEPLKDVLDAFNNGQLDLTDCDCDGDDGNGNSRPSGKPDDSPGGRGNENRPLDALPGFVRGMLSSLF